MRRHHAHLSDEALVALVARSDEDALAELYDRVSRIAYGLALRVLRDERLAEDAVQAGIFQGEDGLDIVLVEGDVAEGEIVAVTIEEAGGAESPTLPPIVASNPV